MTCPTGLRVPLLSRRRSLAVLLWSLGLAAGCEVPAELQPDQILVDSLGLGPRDRVYRVTLANVGGSESPTPDSILVEGAGWVEFFTADGWPRRVFFEADSISPEADGFLRTQEALSSPPMVARDTRWPVSFQGAPPGRYPYRVESGGVEGRGVVVIPSR